MSFTLVASASAAPIAVPAASVNYTTPSGVTRGLDFTTMTIANSAIGDFCGPQTIAIDHDGDAWAIDRTGDISIYSGSSQIASIPSSLVLGGSTATIDTPTPEDCDNQGFATDPDPQTEFSITMDTVPAPGGGTTQYAVVTVGADVATGAGVGFLADSSVILINVASVHADISAGHGNPVSDPTVIAGTVNGDNANDGELGDDGPGTGSNFAAAAISSDGQDLFVLDQGMFSVDTYSMSQVLGANTSDPADDTPATSHTLRLQAQTPLQIPITMIVVPRSPSVTGNDSVWIGGVGTDDVGSGLEELSGSDLESGTSQNGTTIPESNDGDALPVASELAASSNDQDVYAINPDGDGTGSIYQYSVATASSGPVGDMEDAFGEDVAPTPGSGLYGTLALSSDGGLLFVADQSMASIAATSSLGTPDSPAGPVPSSQNLDACDLANGTCPQPGYSVAVAPSPSGNGLDTVYVAGAGGVSEVTESLAPIPSATPGINDLTTPGASTYKVGDKLQVAGTAGGSMPTGWTDPNKSAVITYQWNANGTPIKDATGPTFTLTPAEVNDTVTVTVSESDPGNYVAQAPLTSTGGSVVSAPITTGTPTISGTAAVGKTLTAASGTWTAGATLSYQWSANGTAIKGATHQTLALTASLLGKKIAVAVTGSEAGYTSATKSSLASAAVKRGTLTGPKTIKVTGTAKVGKRLTAGPLKASSFRPGTVKIAYRWFEATSKSGAGKAIKGATRSAYKLAKSTNGKYVHVVVSVTEDGYTTLTLAGKRDRVK